MGPMRLFCSNNGLLVPCFREDIIIDVGIPACERPAFMMAAGSHPLAFPGHHMATKPTTEYSMPRNWTLTHPQYRELIENALAEWEETCVEGVYGNVVQAVRDLFNFLKVT